MNNAKRVSPIVAKLLFTVVRSSSELKYLDITHKSPANIENSKLKEKLVERLPKLVGDVALINNNERVFDVLCTRNKAFKLISVENILFQTIRKAFFSLLNPLFGRMARKDENVGNRCANVILGLVVVASKFVNSCQHRASFTRLCWCDG